MVYARALQSNTGFFHFGETYQAECEIVVKVVGAVWLIELVRMRRMDSHLQINVRVNMQLHVEYNLLQYLMLNVKRIKKSTLSSAL